NAEQKIRPFGSVCGFGITVRMAPLVPMVTAISPLRNAFTPIFESTPSLAPITNFVFGEIPISLQYSEAHPVQISCVDTRRDNESALLPATSRAESSHSSFSRFISPVADAIE